MDAQEGELVALVGPCGCGKTTVLKILAGLHGADGGTMKIGTLDFLLVRTVPPAKLPGDYIARRLCALGFA